MIAPIGAKTFKQAIRWCAEIFYNFKDICEVFYLPRTPSISTTEIVEIIKNNI